MKKYPEYMEKILDLKQIDNDKPLNGLKLKLEIDFILEKQIILLELGEELIYMIMKILFILVIEEIIKKKNTVIFIKTIIKI